MAPTDGLTVSRADTPVHNKAPPRRTLTSCRAGRVTPLQQDDIERIERQFIEAAIEAEDVEAGVDDTHSTDFVGHWFAADRRDTDREGLKAFLAAIHEGFPDLSVDVAFTAATEEMATSGLTFTGTHDGEFMGLDPTGTEATWHALTVHRFADGEIVEGWGVSDDLAVLQQVGVLPEDLSAVAPAADD